MTEKDYRQLARIFYSARVNGLEEITDLVDYIENRIVEYMTDDNPNFNEELFREASTTGKCKGMKS